MESGVGFLLQTFENAFDRVHEIPARRSSKLLNSFAVTSPDNLSASPGAGPMAAHLPTYHVEQKPAEL